MKAIRAVVRPAMRDHVIDVLADVPRHSAIGVSTITEFGRDPENGQLVEVEMTRLEIEVPDDQVEPVCNAIRESARTAGGHTGDGKLIVIPVEIWSTIELG
jgi:nitrogen regulatory protein PII